jgi:hypothetical protein
LLTPVSNTYIFFHFVDERLHKLVRKILPLVFFSSSLSCIWLFGNKAHFTPFFGEHDLSNNIHIEALTTPSSFTLLNKPNLVYPIFQKGYSSEFKKRFQKSQFSTVLLFFILGWTIFLVLRKILDWLEQKEIEKALKKGINHFKSKSVSFQFEDLVGEKEIVERLNLEKKTDGRGLQNKQLREMRKESKNRLISNWKRKKRKKSMKSLATANSCLFIDYRRPGSDGDLVYSNSHEFCTLASYDFRVCFLFTF